MFWAFPLLSRPWSFVPRFTLGGRQVLVHAAFVYSAAFVPSPPGSEHQRFLLTAGYDQYIRSVPYPLRLLLPPDPIPVPVPLLPLLLLLLLPRLWCGTTSATEDGVVLECALRLETKAHEAHINHLLVDPSGIKVRLPQLPGQLNTGGRWHDPGADRSTAVTARAS